jgi:hypothetical protein
MANSLTPELHQQLLHRCLGDSDRYGSSVRRLARQWQLVPLFVDWSGFLGIDCTGQICSVAMNSATEPRFVTDPRMSRIAQASGAESFPELAFLRPVRPLNSENCPSCGGTGKAPMGGDPDAGNVVCYCGGLGWLLPGEGTGISPRGA